MFCLILLLVGGLVRAENICNITVPIGTWFRNHTGPCDIVKGHFILDRLANVFARKLSSTFGGLKSIEGCLYVKGFTGTTDLSFFGNLKSVVSAEANLTNVIEVVGPSLKTMGFNSLGKVEGPGRIILSFEEGQQTYSQMERNMEEIEEGWQCFSKEEMLFLSRHLQFHGKMYRPCEDVKDPCFNLNPWKSTVSDEDFPAPSTTSRPITSKTSATEKFVTYVTRSPITRDPPLFITRTPIIIGPRVDVSPIRTPITSIRNMDTIRTGTVTRTVVTSIRSRTARDIERVISGDPDEITRSSYNRYTFLDIPENCPVFVGVICFCGPYEYTKKDFDRFANLTLLIGQIHITGTLFDNLAAIFPNLRNIYPYESPWGHSDSCNTEVVPDLADITKESSPSPRGEALQVIRVRINRFLTNLSLPSLQSTRPLDLSNPSSGSLRLFTPSYFPESVADVCSHFPQFKPGNCGRFITNQSYFGEIDERRQETATIRFLTIFLTAIGVAFSVRTMILLQFSNAHSCLPYSRRFIIISIFIVTLSTLENCIVHQKIFAVNDNVRQVPQILLEFDSVHLTHPFFQFIMTILVSTKYTCLLLVIFCYIDVILFYRLKSLRLTHYFFILAAALAVLLCIYLHSQIFITIRGREPNYSREPRHVVYMPFIMNTAFAANFSEMIRSTKFIPCVYDMLIFSYESDYKKMHLFYFDQAMLEIHGNIFPEFVNIMDCAIIAVTFAFYFLSYLGAINPHSKFLFLVLLYFQLSINRLRYYIYSLLVDDYCLRKDIWTKDDDYMGPYYTCYTQMFSYRKMKNRGDIIMEEYVWKIIEQILVIVPNITFVATSFACWIFARYASYLGPALQIREHRSMAKISDYDQADPSDCPPSYQKVQ